MKAKPCSEGICTFKISMKRAIKYFNSLTDELEDFTDHLEGWVVEWTKKRHDNIVLATFRFITDVIEERLRVVLRILRAMRAIEVS